MVYSPRPAWSEWNSWSEMLAMTAQSSRFRYSLRSFTMWSSRKRSSRSEGAEDRQECLSHVRSRPGDKWLGVERGDGVVQFGVGPGFVVRILLRFAVEQGAAALARGQRAGEFDGAHEPFDGVGGKRKKFAAGTLEREAMLVFALAGKWAEGGDAETVVAL